MTVFTLVCLSSQIPRIEPSLSNFLCAANIVQWRVIAHKKSIFFTQIYMNSTFVSWKKGIVKSDFTPCLLKLRQIKIEKKIPVCHSFPVLCKYVVTIVYIWSTKLPFFSRCGVNKKVNRHIIHFSDIQVFISSLAVLRLNTRSCLATIQIFLSSHYFKLWHVYT